VSAQILRLIGHGRAIALPVQTVDQGTAGHNGEVGRVFRGDTEAHHFKYNIGDMDAVTVDVTSLSDFDVKQLEFNLFKFLMQHALRHWGFPAELLPFPCYDPFLCPAHQNVLSY